MKICSKCKIEKPKSEFNSHKIEKDGLNSRCKKCCKIANKIWYDNNKDRKIIYDKLRGKLLKKEVFDVYGGAVCVKCGIDNFDVLTIDHINGGGVQHAKKFGSKLYEWLKRNNYPSGFRVLCRNCNDADGYLRHFKPESQNYNTLYARNYKKKVFELLGKSCVLCGENKVECLHIDHINGGGCQHRLKRSYNGVCIDVIAEEFPEKKYRILCSNCNWLEYLSKLRGERE